MTQTIAAPLTAPLETVTPIRPSEAIRLGCLLAPVQTFHEAGIGLRACVMKALDIGSAGDATTYAFVGNLRNLECRDCSQVSSGGMLLIHLNDTHRWSRERIADWLESLGL